MTLLAPPLKRMARSTIFGEANGSTSNIATMNTFCDVVSKTKRYRPVMAAIMYRNMNVYMSILSSIFGSFRWAIGSSAKMDVTKGRNAFRIRYEVVLVAIRLYRDAVRPLKLMVRDTASGQLLGKFFMHNTKEIVLNHVILQPADKHKINAAR